MSPSHATLRRNALTLQDRSRYFLGLLLLTARDRVLHPEERRRLRDIASRLGFEPGFCENAMDNVLLNPYLLDKPVRFSSSRVARAFLSDALQLALSDGELAATEWDWLESVALINGIPPQWLSAQRADAVLHPQTDTWAAETWWTGGETDSER